MTSKDDLIAVHLRAMRRIWMVFLAAVPVALVSMAVLPRLRAAAASPSAVTLLALAGSLWICFTADRDARSRLDRAKREFAVRADPGKLLNRHRMVFLVVMVRLEIVVACSIVVAVWGVGWTVAVWFAVLAAVMIWLARPSEHKTRLLVSRAEELRGEG